MLALARTRGEHQAHLPLPQLLQRGERHQRARQRLSCQHEGGRALQARQGIEQALRGSAGADLQALQAAEGADCSSRIRLQRPAANHEVGQAGHAATQPAGHAWQAGIKIEAQAGQSAGLQAGQHAGKLLHAAGVAAAVDVAAVLYDSD